MLLALIVPIVLNVTVSPGAAPEDGLPNGSGVTAVTVYTVGGDVGVTTAAGIANGANGVGANEPASAQALPAKL